MTFIVAIQLNDSIIIASDNKNATILEDGTLTFPKDHISKLFPWKNGIVTGTGEYYVISRAVKIFNNFKKLPPQYFADCLEISRKIREFEIGKGYYQVDNTKLMYSTYTDNGAQLYRVESFDPNEKYQVTAAEKMDITIWLFNPTIETIALNLKDLYDDLKDRSYFKNNEEWVNYYIERLSPIFKKQSIQDIYMSQSFDVFFQTKDQYIYGHFPNI
ncbi:hypothetical protein ACG9XL_17270 [Acinetobacter nosocomialis]|uniref:hypothetical protein n=1 Tax=Acinetobacter calcoaceticus/baumannii complex TaxID=909768 RepID=UPI0024DEB4E6|nr:hypothetical protein [Acinetobacter baumannii]MDK2172838.1 hypothetical protein [Acinetobacter baumannii]MDK2183710.1 hypothetical protein [Acinetobacter baumannii]MDK2329534.1 hypothetical protein [Acinetobacter baumannii]HCA5286824.1 hypothetical protein [Acinetobacter nosocomialis]